MRARYGQRTAPGRSNRAQYVGRSGPNARPPQLAGGLFHARTSREMSARRSVSRVLSRRPEATVMAIHLGPPVTRRLMRPTRGLGSAPLPRRVAPHGLRPPIWPCSGWSLPRFTPSPACAADGIVTVALVLVSRRTGVTRHPALRSSDVPHADEVAPDGARPSDRLADEAILAAVRFDSGTTARCVPPHRGRRAGTAHPAGAGCSRVTRTIRPAGPLKTS